MICRPATSWRGDRGAGGDARGTRLRRALRRLHGLLHIVLVHPHRARRERDAGPCSCRAAVPAPRLPAGHVLLGYDEQGCCPCWSVAGAPSTTIGPRTCRTYDCRIFPAAGIGIEDEDGDKALISRRARRWRFYYPTQADRDQHDAVRVAARHLEQHGVDANGRGPSNATKLAVQAVEGHRVLLSPRRAGLTGRVGSHP